MKIKVVEVIENEDGSANYLFDLDQEAMIILAKMGLMAALEKAANELGHIDSEGAGDTEAGEDGDPPVHGEVPGL